MKKLLLALALVLASSSAWAQNTQCSNRPTGDSTNACANTRFVGTALGSLNLVVGGTTISSGTTTRILYNNAGVLGEYPIGTGVATALGVNVGSAGAFVTFNGALGTPSSGTATNLTGLPISTGLTGAGTGVLTALAVNVGSAGAFVTFNGALGTPSSGTVTNLTGTASININGTVGATTPTTGVFTTVVGNTSVASAIHVGGAAAASTITIQSTTGAGVGAESILFKNGNNGATQVGSIVGVNWTIGATPRTSDVLNIEAGANKGVSVENTAGSVQTFLRWNASAGGYIGVLDTAAAASTLIAGTGDSYIAAPAAGASLGVNTQSTLPAAMTGVAKYLTVNGFLQHSVVGFGSLPACNASNIGARAGVTDSNTAVFLANIAAGGANKVPAYCNGANWVVG